MTQGRPRTNGDDRWKTGALGPEQTVLILQIGGDLFFGHFLAERRPNYAKGLFRLHYRKASQGDFVFIFDLPQFFHQSRGGHNRHVRQFVGKFVFQADGHGIGLDAQPADVRRLQNPHRGLQNADRGLANEKIDARRFLTQLDGIAGVANNRIPVVADQ